MKSTFFAGFSGAIFTIRHCSACAKDDPNWCGPEFPFCRSSAYAILSGGGNATFSVTELPGEMKASKPNRSTFELSGVFQATLNATISFDISSGTGAHHVAVVSFPAPNTALLTVSTEGSNPTFDCRSSKSAANNLSLDCDLPFGARFTLNGSFNKV
jgi:hypothetical protein